MRPIAALPGRTHLPPVLLQHHRATPGFRKASTGLTGSATARTGLASYFMPPERRHTAVNTLPLGFR